MSFQIITSIGKIFSLTNYDLKNNAKKWMSLVCLQTLIVVILNFHYFLPGSVDLLVLDFFDYIGSLELGLGEEYFSLAVNVTSLLMVIKFIIACLVELCLHVLFPIIILQNALDLAFDSQMRGLAIKGPIFSYVFTIASLVFLRNFILDYSEMLIEYYVAAVQSSVIYSIILAVFLLAITFFYIYIFQCLRFTGLHILEYRSGILQAMQTSFAMTRGKIFFVFLISTIQVLTLLCFDIVGEYFIALSSLGINSIVTLFPVDLLSSTIFSFVLSNLVTIFSMFFSSCIMIWFYSVESHVYRQLICPVTEKTACESCECAS